MTKWFAVSYAPEARITAFGPYAVINESAKTIAWAVPSGTEVTTLAPTFTLSTGATAYSTDPTLTPPPAPVVITSGTARDFTNPVHYWVKSSDDLITANYTVTVSVAALPVTTGLACWFDAAMGTTTDTGGVLTWADQSTNGHTATRAQGTMQIIPGAINGLPAVQFAGDAYAPIAGNMYSKTQFIVTKMNGGDWGAWMGSAPQSGYMWNQNGNCWDGNVPAAASKNGTALSSYPFYLGDDRNSQYMILKIVGNDNTTSQRTYELGRAQQNWHSLNNYLAEIISYSTTLSEDDEDRVGGYLATKYARGNATRVARRITAGAPGLTPSGIPRRAAVTCWTPRAARPAWASRPTATRIRGRTGAVSAMHGSSNRRCLAITPPTPRCSPSTALTRITNTTSSSPACKMTTTSLRIGWLELRSSMWRTIRAVPPTGWRGGITMLSDWGFRADAHSSCSRRKMSWHLLAFRTNS
ncbi:MAG: hypothetical protein NTW21_23005 [Verrucomicrobia bacterium]|nr:hypothetical protein [Verrucomicrobiota bacterium]